MAFQSRQLPCGPGILNSQGTLRAHVRFVGAVCVSDSLNLFRDLPVSFQHAFSFQSLSVLCSFGQVRLMLTGL